MNSAVGSEFFNVEELSAELKGIVANTVVSTASFGYTFFPKFFYASYHSLLRQMLEAMDSEHDKVAIFAPRGMGKTSWALYGYCARVLVNSLNRFLVYLSNSSTSAQRGTENLKKALIENKELQVIYGPMHPAVIPNENGINNSFSAAAWSLANGSFICPRGAGQQVRGLQVYVNGEILRPDVILIDDLENSEEVQSPEMRLKLRTWFFGDLLKVESRYGKPAKIIYIDTMKHEDSIGTYLQDDPGWHVVVLSACDDELNTNAPEYMTNAQIRDEYERHVRSGMEDVFFREFCNKVVSTKNRTFKPENFRYFYEMPFNKIGIVMPEAATAFKEKAALGVLTEVEKEKCRADLFTLKYGGIPISQQYVAGRVVGAHNVIIVDPAKTQKTDSADTAIVLVTVTELGFIFVRRTISGKFTPLDIYREIVQLCYEFNVFRIAVEVTGLASFITQPLIDYLRASKLEYLANTLVQLSAAKTKKNERIAWLAPLYQRHMIYHNLACYSKLEGQLKSFPAAKLVDLMDCLAWIVHLIGELEFVFSTPDIEGGHYDEPTEEENNFGFDYDDD